MKTICIYCGSSEPRDPIYREACLNLVEEMANQALDLVYGGANVGIMGILANELLRRGRRVCGVIPEVLLCRELTHVELSETILVNSMSERKQKMAEKADGFIAFPGGIGTLDELFECLTCGTLGIHSKPIGLLNVGGYFDELLAFLNKAVQTGFISPENRRVLLVSSDPAELFEKMRQYVPPELPDWLKNKENPWGR